MSLRIVCGARQAIIGQRMKPDGESTRERIAPTIFCWRRSRVRSSSRGLQRLCRVRASASACRPSMCVVPAFSRSVKPPLRNPPLMRDTTQPPL